MELWNPTNGTGLTCLNNTHTHAHSTHKEREREAIGSEGGQAKETMAEWSRVFGRLDGD